MVDPIALLPSSMRAYLEHSDIKMAVDKLAEVDLDYLPSAMSWKEYSDYLNAKAMADLTRNEFGIGLKNLWDFIWGSQIVGHWKMASVDDMKVKQDISIGEMWEETDITVMHNCINYYLYTAVEVNAESLTLTFGMETDEDFIAKGEVSGYVWVEGKKGDWHEWNVARLPGNVALTPELLQIARERAQRALDWCDAYLGRKGLT